MSGRGFIKTFFTISEQGQPINLECYCLHLVSGVTTWDLLSSKKVERAKTPQAVAL